MMANVLMQLKKALKKLIKNGVNVPVATPLKRIIQVAMQCL